MYARNIIHMQSTYARTRSPSFGSSTIETLWLVMRKVRHDYGTTTAAEQARYLPTEPRENPSKGKPRNEGKSGPLKPTKTPHHRRGCRNPFKPHACQTGRAHRHDGDHNTTALSIHPHADHAHGWEQGRVAGTFFTYTILALCHLSHIMET